MVPTPLKYLSAIHVGQGKIRYYEIRTFGAGQMKPLLTRRGNNNIIPLGGQIARKHVTDVRFSLDDKNLWWRQALRLRDHIAGASKRDCSTCLEVQ
jgi:hypothetical protein